MKKKARRSQEVLAGSQMVGQREYDGERGKNAAVAIFCIERINRESFRSFSTLSIAFWIGLLISFGRHVSLPQGCVLCRSCEDDPALLGDKITLRDDKLCVHYFCLVSFKFAFSPDFSTGRPSIGRKPSSPAEAFDLTAPASPCS